MTEVSKPTDKEAIEAFLLEFLLKVASEGAGRIWRGTMRQLLTRYTLQWWRSC